MSLNSIELEKQLLAGLIKHPEAFIDLAPFIDEDDFDDSVDLVNKTIFTVLKHAIENGTQLDHVGLSERINSLGLTFDANVHIGTYVQALDLRKCPKNAILSTAKDLKNITIRRNGISKCREMAKFFEKTPLDTPFETLINSSDKLWNEHINTYDVSSSNPENCRFPFISLSYQKIYPSPLNFAESPKFGVTITCVNCTGFPLGVSTSPVIIPFGLRNP